MKEKGALRVSFYYGENDVVGHNMLTGEPIRADQVMITILGQIFRTDYKIITTQKEATRNLKRESACLFGEALQQIGKEIQKQATHGKPMEKSVKGKRFIRF